MDAFYRDVPSTASTSASTSACSALPNQAVLQCEGAGHELGETIFPEHLQLRTARLLTGSGGQPPALKKGEGSQQHALSACSRSTSGGAVASLYDHIGNGATGCVGGCAVCGSAEA
jgi:hypothetical protein